MREHDKHRLFRPHAGRRNNFHFPSTYHVCTHIIDVKERELLNLGHCIRVSYVPITNKLIFIGFPIEMISSFVKINFVQISSSVRREIWERGRRKQRYYETNLAIFLHIFTSIKRFFEFPFRFLLAEWIRFDPTWDTRQEINSCGFLSPKTILFFTIINLQ